MGGNGVLGVLGGVAVGRMENAAKGAKTEARTAGHHAEMAEIAADNATSAANNAARLAGIAANNASVAVQEGREQTQQILDSLGRATLDHIMPTLNKNSADIAALTDLVKELNARLDKLQTQINKQE